MDNTRDTKFNKRRPYNDDHPCSYMESDADFVRNNFDLCVIILDGIENAIERGDDLSGLFVALGLLE